MKPQSRCSQFAQLCRYLPLFIFILLVFLPTGSVLADMAPPAQPPGTNLLPDDENTQVRMVAETVLIVVQDPVPENSVGRAQVTADFTMRNLGNSDETMAARFPISANDGYFNYPEIQNLQVEIDGRVVGTRRIESYDPFDEDATIPWAEFDVTFPIQQDVEVRVSYTLKGTGEYPYVSFAYLLETGGGWFDTIGSADLIVRLPYEANAYNVFVDSGPGWGGTTAGATFVGNEVRWRFEDFEPAYEHNLSIALVMPEAWKKVLIEQENVAADAQDGEAWGRLGKNYKEVSRLRRGTRLDQGGMDLYELSVDAYERALALLPDDALWHAGFADLLLEHYYWAFTSDGLTGTIRGLEELYLAYSLDPDEPFILNLLEEVYGGLPNAVEKDQDTYIFLWLTATPTPWATDTPPNPTDSPTATPTPPKIALSTAEPTETSIAAPTSTQAPLATQPGAQPKPQSDSGPSLPFCGAALLVPLLAVFSMRKKERL